MRSLGTKQKPLQKLVNSRDARHKTGRGVSKPPGVGRIHITTSASIPQPRPIRKKPIGRRIKNISKIRKSLLNKTKDKRDNWTKRSIIDIYQCFKSGKLVSQYKGPKQESTTDSLPPPSTEIIAAVAKAALDTALSNHSSTSLKDKSSAAPSRSKEVSLVTKKRGRPSKKELKERIERERPELSESSSDTER